MRGYYSGAAEAENDVMSVTDECAFPNKTNNKLPFKVNVNVWMNDLRKQSWSLAYYDLYDFKRLLKVQSV